MQFVFKNLSVKFNQTFSGIYLEIYVVQLPNPAMKL